MRTATRQAFTLIELLVVIAIIALLVGILVPALGAAKKQAQIAICTKNVKSINTGVMFYLNVYKETFPATGNFGNAYDGNNDGTDQRLNYMNLVGKKAVGSGWSLFGIAPSDPEDRLVNKYIDGTIELAECPLDRGSDLGDDDSTAFDGWGSSYFYPNRFENEMIALQKKGQDGIWALEGHRAVEVTATTKKLVIADVLVYKPKSGHDDVAGGRPHPKHTWHSIKDPMNVNVAYVDGHVKNTQRNTADSARVTVFNTTNGAIDQWIRDSNRKYY